MKTSLLYGFISALGGAFLTLILFFLGFHSDPAKLGTAGWVGGLIGTAVAVVCVVLGVKARKAEAPPDQPFGYGKAFGAGMMVSVVSSVLGALFAFLYWAVINPGISDIVVQSQVAKFEANGLTGDKLDNAEAMVRKMASPLPQAITALIFGLLFGLVISLIVAAILKKPEPESPPTL